MSKSPVKKRDISLMLSLALITLGLLIWGLFMIFSSSAYNGGAESADTFHYLRTQLIAEFAGIIVILFFLTPAGKWMFELIGSNKFRILLLMAAAVSVIMLKFFGISVNGAIRWYKIPGTSISVQPAEFVKIAVIIYLAGMVADYPILGRVGRFKGYLTLFVPPLILAGLVYVITDNLSSAIIIMGITILMIFVTIKDIKVHATFVGIGAVVLTWYLSRVSQMDYSADIDYRTRRVMVWLNPEAHLRDGGFQPLQALYAIGSGGLTGKGIGRSIQKLGTIPEVHNDMIFSVICEETGLIGAALLILVFFAMIFVMYLIAARTVDIYGKMVVLGVMFHIAIQVSLNIMVVTGLMPNTGVGLPFISYGGSSVLFLLAELGMVFLVVKENITRHV